MQAEKVTKANTNGNPMMIKDWYKDSFKELFFRLDGNLYGRRTAGSVYRNELEEILCTKVGPQRYAFSRGEKDPCVFRWDKSGIVQIHHIDDIRMAGPKEAVNHFGWSRNAETLRGPSRRARKRGNSCWVPGSYQGTNQRCYHHDTRWDAHQSCHRCCGNLRQRRQWGSFQTTKPLRNGASWRGRCQALSLGSRISDLPVAGQTQYAVKEAAQHMSQPRKCDMQAVKTLAAYLQSHPHVGWLTTCDPNCSSEWPCDLYSDSDWARCLATRRSTDCYIAVAHRPNRAYQRQVRRMLSSGEFRGQLGKLSSSRSWSPEILASSAENPAYRIGPGSKLRHLEVCEFYVQGTLQSKQIALGKVKGTVNCANFLTKHPNSGTEVRQAMHGLGMYEARDGEDVLSSSKKISVKVSTLTKQHAWKTPTPACVGWIKDQDRAGRTATAYRQDGQVVGCIKALVVLSQIQAVAGQPTYCVSPREWYALYFLAAIGNLCADMETGRTVHRLLCGLVMSNRASSSRSRPWGAIAHRRSADHLATQGDCH